MFNALNTIRALIRKSPDQARERVADLADLYRYLLSHPADATVEQEVAHALAYLHIEQSRLGADRVTLHANVSKDVASVQLPALTLQPLVENAIRHGVGRHERGRVEILAERQQGAVVLRVEEQHEGTPQPPPKGHGVALENLRKRMEHRFGSDAKLALEIANNRSCATLRIPIVNDTSAATSPEQR